MSLIEISNDNIIEGRITTILPIADVPSAGTSAVWTVTLADTISSGSFTITYTGDEGTETSGAITWSATNSTLLAHINAATDAMTLFGDGELLAEDDALTLGIGTLTLTFGGAFEKLLVGTLTIDDALIVGSGGAVTIEETTPGVTADFRGRGVGVICSDYTHGKLYINTGTATAPTWTVVGAQS